MQLLNDADGVQIYNAAGGWFFKVTKDEVKFYITRNEQWDGSELAEHVIGRKAFEVLIYGMYPNACLFEGTARGEAKVDVFRQFRPDIIEKAKEAVSAQPDVELPAEALTTLTDEKPIDIGDGNGVTVSVEGGDDVKNMVKYTDSDYTMEGGEVVSGRLVVENAPKIKGTLKATIKTKGK